MHIIIIIFVFVGLCLGLNIFVILSGGRVITDKVLGTTSSPASSSAAVASKFLQPKMSRSAPITSVNPEFLIEAENFWRTWLGGPAYEESEPATQKSEPPILVPVLSSTLPPNLNEDNWTAGENETEGILSENLENSTSILDDLTENLTSNLTEIGINSSEISNHSMIELADNSTEVIDNAEVSDSKKLLDSSAALLKTPQEQQLYITKLFVALSNEIINITGQQPLGSPSPSSLKSSSPEPMAIEGAFKAAASKLTPTDRALFENLVILSLLRTTATAPPKTHKTPDLPLVVPDNPMETEAAANLVPNLKSSHPDVAAVLKEVSLLTGEPEENEEEKALAIESSPDFGRLVFILKNLYQKAGAPTPTPEPATEGTEATEETSDNGEESEELNSEESSSPTMTTTADEMTTTKSAVTAPPPDTSRAILLDLLLKIAKLRSQITTTASPASEEEGAGDDHDEAEDEDVTMTTELVSTTTPTSSIEQAKRLKKILIYLIMSKNFTMTTTPAPST